MRLIDADALIQDMIDKKIPFNADVNEAILSAREIGGYADYVDRVWEIAYERGKEEASQWIPCSERLPEYMELVLTWDGSTYFVEKRIAAIRDIDNGEVISGDWWVSDDYDENESDYYPNLRDGACIAWMPLPKPYGGDDQ